MEGRGPARLTVSCLQIACHIEPTGRQRANEKEQFGFMAALRRTKPPLNQLRKIDIIRQGTRPTYFQQLEPEPAGHVRLRKPNQREFAETEDRGHWARRHLGIQKAS